MSTVHMTPPPPVAGSRGPVGWFANRTVATKIMTALAVTTVSAAAAGWVGLAALSSANGRATGMHEDNLVGTRELTDTQGLMRLAAAQVPLMALADDVEIQNHVELHGTLSAQREDTFAKYTARPLDAETRTAVARYEHAMARYVTLRDAKLIPLAMAHRLVEF